MTSTAFHSCIFIRVNYRGLETDFCCCKVGIITNKIFLLKTAMRSPLPVVQLEGRTHCFPETEGERQKFSASIHMPVILLVLPGIKLYTRA